MFRFSFFHKSIYAVRYHMGKWGKWKKGDVLLIGYVTYMGYCVGCVLSLHEALLFVGMYCHMQ